MTENILLPMITSLRQKEEVILYKNVLEIAETDRQKTIEFLASEFREESLDYPFTCPAFNKNAAIRAAEIVYLTAQLILYREHSEKDLQALFQESLKEADASEILSADLCLRFIPEMLNRLKLIDPEDEIIPILEKILIKWHFSAVSYPLNPEDLNFEVIIKDECLHQMYCNRIIEHKRRDLALHQAFSDRINGNLGLHQKLFWKELTEE